MTKTKLIFDSSAESACYIEADSKSGIVEGLCALVQEASGLTAMSPQEVVCRMAVKLFGPCNQSPAGS